MARLPLQSPASTMWIFACNTWHVSKSTLTLPQTLTQSTMEPNMQDILNAFLMTIELWVFLAILMVALFVEEGVIAYNKRKLVDNPALQ